MEKLKELKLKTAKEILRLDDILKTPAYSENRKSIMNIVVEFQLDNKRDFLTLIECLEETTVKL